jgi:hypothetical protein
MAETMNGRWAEVSYYQWCESIDPAATASSHSLAYLFRICTEARYDLEHRGDILRPGSTHQPT